MKVSGKASHAGVDFRAGASAITELAYQIGVIEKFTNLKRGLTVNPAALQWWKLFSTVKGCAIWTTSAKEFCEGSHDLVLGFAGTYTARRHDRIMADLLERLVEEGWS